MRSEPRRSGIASTSERTGQIGQIGRIPQLFQSRHSRTRSSILRLGEGRGLRYRCHACRLPVQHIPPSPPFPCTRIIQSVRFDSDVPSTFTQTSDGKWELDIMGGWPSSIQLNVFDFDNYFYGDTDGDGVLDRLPSNSLAVNFVHMSAPPKPPRRCPGASNQEVTSPSALSSTVSSSSSHSSPPYN